MLILESLFQNFGTCIQKQNIIICEHYLTSNDNCYSFLNILEKHCLMYKEIWKQEVLLDQDKRVAVKALKSVLAKFTRKIIKRR